MRSRSQPTEKRIFFPWESRGGLARRLRLGRVRPYLIGGLVVGLVVVVGVRERRAAGIRQTRAQILEVRRAVDAYLADHDAGCPASLDATRASGNFKELPHDAWGKPLRLVCPGRREGSNYELMSDGPDGLPAGLDRIE